MAVHKNFLVVLFQNVIFCDDGRIIRNRTWLCGLGFQEKDLSDSCMINEYGNEEI